MQIGNKKYTLKIESQPTDRRPKRWPLLTQWTFWKCMIVVQMFVGMISITEVIRIHSGAESDTSIWFWAAMSLQVLAIFNSYPNHKRQLAWRAEHPEYYDGTF